MDKDARDELRAGFELQLRHIFYSKPEFPYLPSMGCYHVFFPVRNEEHDFGFLVLEWECFPGQMWHWSSTWVDTEEELKSLQNLLLVSEQGRLTDNGAQLLEKLHLFDQSFVSKKIDFTDRTAAFDALFEDL